MRILVTGSRDWDKPGDILTLLMPYMGYDVTLVSGACPTGADSQAEDFAEGFGWTVERHPADWEQFGKRAGYLRNQHMVDLGADLCLAFIKDNSRGASMCAGLAEKAGIRTVRHIV